MITREILAKGFFYFFLIVFVAMVWVIFFFALADVQVPNFAVYIMLGSVLGMGVSIVKGLKNGRDYSDKVEKMFYEENKKGS